MFRHYPLHLRIGVVRASASVEVMLQVWQMREPRNEAFREAGHVAYVGPLGFRGSSSSL